MAETRKKFSKGIRLSPTDEATTKDGELRSDATEKRIKVYHDTDGIDAAGEYELASTSQTQEFTNKTYTDPVLNGDVSGTAIDTDVNLAADSDTKIPSQKAVKAYVDTSIAGKDEMSEISYDNSTSGLSATNGQDAIDEVEGRVDAVETAASDAQTDINNHIAETTDAHDASAISVTPAGNLTSTDAQAALEELQTDVDTRALASDLTDHINDTTDAHDASAISYDNTTSTLAATDAQAAIDEVGGRLDTVESDIQTIEDDHVAASSGVHGVTGNVVGDSDTQTMSNKTLDSTNTFSGAIDNPTKLEAKQDTKANLETYAATAANGELVYATDTDQMFRVLDGTLAELGSGGGGLDVYYTEDMEDFLNVSDFSTGNNVTFLGGGTLAGTLALETVAPISGDQSLSYTQAAGSLNDYFASPLIDVGLKQQNNDSGMTLYFTYDGDTNDGKFIVWDVTNSRELTSGIELVESSSKASRCALSFYVPANCTQIRWGYQVLVENIGAKLVVDDVEFTLDPFKFGYIIDGPRTVVRGAGNGGESITENVTDIPFTVVEDDLGLWDGTQFTVPEDGDYIVTGSINVNRNIFSWRIYGYVNGTENMTMGGNFDGVDLASFSKVFTLNKNDVLTVRSSDPLTLVNTPENHHIHIQKIPEATEHVITPAKSVDTAVGSIMAFATEDAPKGYLYCDGSAVSRSTYADLFSVIGTMYGDGDGSTTFNLPDYRGYFLRGLDDGAGVDTDATLRADRGDDTMGDAVGTKQGDAIRNVTGVIGRFVGRGINLNSTDPFYRNGSNQSMRAGEYGDKGTAIGLSMDLSRSVPTADENRPKNIAVKYYIRHTNSPFLAAIPTPKTAYIKDVKPSGTDGGTFTAGAWQTRTLNTLEGDTGFVSLSANQVTLAPGKYEIEASAPAYRIGAHQAKLRNITDSTDQIIGSQGMASDVGVVLTESFIKGRISITSSKTFEIQHRSRDTRAGSGLGSSTTFGVDNIFTQVKITKVG